MAESHWKNKGVCVVKSAEIDRALAPVAPGIDRICDILVKAKEVDPWMVLMLSLYHSVEKILRRGHALESHNL